MNNDFEFFIIYIFEEINMFIYNGNYIRKRYNVLIFIIYFYLWINFKVLWRVVLLLEIGLGFYK